ncbi:MAG: endolytic transglycosylase MltG [Treponema sp.]|nr:endolytic transglycosylase MltG [Treponema sp.]
MFSAAVLGGIAYFNAPPGKVFPGTDGPVVFEVQKGESAQSVGRRLEEKGIIKNRYFWHLLARVDTGYLKAGTYSLELPATQLEIRSVLKTGRQLLQRVTIPEGVTLKKTARLLAEAEICPEDAFLAAAADRDILSAYQIPGLTMEGYLYPDTYLFPRNYPASRVIAAMADTFFARLADIRKDRASISPEELNRRVIIASIVEREYRVDEEAPWMAGIFYNRLKIGMALQSCATVEYVITEIQGRPHPEVVYTRDTEIRNPYNTYMSPGLPPGPISSPGKTALEAAFNPVESDYLYFRLVDPDSGRHYFSKTLDDHIQAGVLYVKGNSEAL